MSLIVIFPRLENNLNPKLESTQLYKYLKKTNEVLAQRVVAIRDEQAKWLPLIVTTYPHYPNHGIEHSERIITQLSHMLFKGTKPTVKFSATEVYCLLCAAYLHDMGMVISPGEISSILTQDNWKKFVTNGGSGYEAFKAYEALRAGPTQDSNVRTDFLADQALRYLIADFLRREHHERSKTTLEMHSYLKQLVSDNDSVAFETISNINVGHGLIASELSDDSRFPDERDVFGEKINVRFLARLLRIGDLLDMSSRRADPMTASGIGPLPTDAIPHWQQYSGKKHENISPKVIEFTFECKDQETHRILRDWFGLLETEVYLTGLEILHAARHDNWKPPRCIVSSLANSIDARVGVTKPSIIIKPSPNANYTFHDWKLELDHEEVLKRLISDVYDDPSVFVRELIQNALDANRCQMYTDFEAQNSDVAAPSCPTHFSHEFRERYPVFVSLTEEEVQLSSDGPLESRQIFTIEDSGTGMSEEIIKHYFLQVGRSYYKSKQFQQRYKFAPTSRFGVGFLSVFAVSEYVIVDTATINPTSLESIGIRLHLRGPKSYLLTENWDSFKERSKHERHGTRIRVILSSKRGKQSLEDVVKNLCVHVEVPIKVRELSRESLISHVPLSDNKIVSQSRVDPKAKFIQHVFEVNRYGVEGQIAIVAYEDDHGEGWCDCWSEQTDLAGDRIDAPPKFQSDFISFHGINTDHSIKPHIFYFRERPWSYYLDVRSARVTAPMSRNPGRWVDKNTGDFLITNHDQPSSTITELAFKASSEVAQEAVENHFAITSRSKGEQGCYYVGRVLSIAPVSDLWQKNYPKTIITWDKGKRIDSTAKEVLAFDSLVLAYWIIPFQILPTPYPAMKFHPSLINKDSLIISPCDMPKFVHDNLKEYIQNRAILSVEVHDDLLLIEFGNTTSDASIERIYLNEHWYLYDLGSEEQALFSPKILDVSGKTWSLLNRSHPIVKWLIKLQKASIKTPSLVNPAAVRAAWKCIAESPWEVDELMSKWRAEIGVKKELSPPDNKEYSSIAGKVSLVERRTIT